MISGPRPWLSTCATAGTLARMVTPSGTVRPVMPARACVPMRNAHNSAASDQVHPKIVTAYSFAAKPRDTETKNEQGETVPPRELSGEIDPESDVGKWRASLLEGGDAGEDALMITKTADFSNVLIGVADGVGGWTENGIDPAHYSNALLYYATQYAKSKGAVPTPTETLKYAFEKVSQDQNVKAGSSTVCLVQMDAVQGKLISANLGDSGYVHLRPDPDSDEGRMEVVGQSPSQTYGFNTPYQLAKVPESMKQPGSLSNRPEDAQLNEEDLRRGDMVLLMTDGFLDNVHCVLPPKEALTPDAPKRAELLQLLDMLQDKHREHWSTRKQPSSVIDEKQDFTNVVASTLMQYARLCQSTEEKVSPFQLDAARYGIHYPGGKVDDIALICATIV
ncbi:protein-serine/threonine phosphatase [Malassezia yamatoensis]|uniref:Protein phosphatase n=1 Tax=Malassezia yamatoensis TaxID=253288 RepID=A0AAJ5YUN8_9BASI|nr:protein-serine/threonine phosphatase [Malassezia yamatoensis]